MAERRVVRGRILMGNPPWPAVAGYYTDPLPMRLSRIALLASFLALPVHRDSEANAAMHLRLVKSDPAASATIAAPTQLRLWFSLKPTISVTTVKLANAAKAPIKLAKPTFAGDVKLPVTVTIEEPLAPGTYTVTWKTASGDLHAMTGDYTFTVK